MSLRENEYSKQLKRKTTEELISMLQSHETYLDVLLQALIWELEERGESSALQQELQKQITERAEFESAAEEAILEIPAAPAETIVIEEKKPLPILFSQTAILGFTLFFSPITGGILLSMNIARMQKKGVIPVVIFSIIFSLFQGYVSMQLQPGSIIPILLNVAGGLLLSEFIWNNFLGKGLAYKRRSIIIPLIIVIAIFAPIAWYLYQHPELLNLDL